MGWPVLALCFEACWFGELSQHPIRPHWVHLRRCSHHPPVAKQSTQPVLVGLAVGLIPSLKLHVPPVSFALKLTVVVYMYVGYRLVNIANKLTNKPTVPAAEQRILGTNFRSIRLSCNEYKDMNRHW
jgi:xanthosine utilization system XapX-like protein